MPDTFAHHAVIDGRLATNTAALVQIAAAARTLGRARRTGSHIMARQLVGAATGCLENAASFCPERGAILLALVELLDWACDRIGWPDMDVVGAVLAEAERIEAALKGGVS